MTDPRNPDPQHDREFDDYLAGRHALSVRYLDASRETAPPELDAAILAAARAAVAGTPRRRARSRWRVPLAAAATMVLGVSLMSQLRDDALPEAVRSEADAPLMQSAPAASVADGAEAVEMLAAEAVADAVAPSAPMPPPPMAQAKAVTPPPSQSDLGDRGSEERLDAAPMQRPEAAAQRERSAGAERRPAAPQARAFALAPAPAPAPSEAADLDAVSHAARELLGLLRSGTADEVGARASAPSRPAVLAALSGFADAHAAQVFAAGDGRWRVVYHDATGEAIGVAVLEFSGTDWTLLSLEIAAPGPGVE